LRRVWPAFFSTERRVDLVQDGIDVALRVGDIVDESRVARRVLTYRHVLVASPQLLERLGKPRSVEDHLLYPSHRHPSSIVRAYLDFCQAQAYADPAFSRTPA